MNEGETGRQPSRGIRARREFPLTLRKWSISPLRQTVAAAAVSVFLLLAFFLIETLSASGISGHVADIRPALLCLALLGFSIVSYVVWPSRWNILAHTQLAFGIVAYVIPVLLLGGTEEVPDGVLNLYTGIMFAGFTCAVAGTVVGGWLATRRRVVRALHRSDFLPPEQVRAVVPRRVLVIALLSIAGISVAFWVMGFIPALAPDPFAAKFFRGAYAESYAPVAPLYRATTSALTALLPLLTMYMLWRRKATWIVLFLAAFSVLLLTLQREPALSGVLLFIGVLVALHRRGMFLYFLGIVGVYFAGSASYFVLAALGVSNFASGVHISPVGLLESVAAGAPDVSDQFLFLTSWLQNPVYANGLTFIGGLVPGNFEWNPSVWSLVVTHPGVDITTLNSGGFRLPGPLWGYVNLGWAGAAAVGLVYGLAMGFLAKTASHILSKQIRLASGVSTRSRERIAVTFVAYAAVIDSVGQFYALSYVSVIQTVLILAIIFVGRRLPARQRSLSDVTAP